MKNILKALLAGFGFVTVCCVIAGLFFYVAAYNAFLAIFIAGSLFFSAMAYENNG